MSLAAQLESAFPAIASIERDSLRRLVFDLWDYVSRRNPAWRDIRAIPLHPTMPMEQMEFVKTPDVLYFGGIAGSFGYSRATYSIVAPLTAYTFGPIATSAESPL